MGGGKEAGATGAPPRRPKTKRLVENRLSGQLADRCAQKQVAFAARIREYEYREVVAANAEGERLIIIDGMVLDVKRWLPEHPGGSKV